MGFLKAVAVITGSWIRTAVTGQRIGLNDPDYPNELVLYSGNVAEVTPARLRGGSAASNVGSTELRSPALVADQYSWLDLEGFDDGHTVATLSADVVKLEAGDFVRILGFGTGVVIGSDIADSVTVVGKTITRTGETWHTVGGVGEPAFVNSWVNFGGSSPVAEFYKYPDGDVGLRGVVKSGTAVRIFTLPADYWPPASISWSVPISGGSARLIVEADGDVTIAVTAGSQSFTEITGRFSTLA